jgi:hypothetical protein
VRLPVPPWRPARGYAEDEVIEAYGGETSSAWEAAIVNSVNKDGTYTVVYHWNDPNERFVENDKAPRQMRPNPDARRAERAAHTWKIFPSFGPLKSTQAERFRQELTFKVCGVCGCQCVVASV